MSSSNVAPESTSNTHETQKFQSQIGHISRHSGVYFAGTLFRISTGYFFKVYLARTLGAEPLGIYALGMTIIGFLGIFNGLGLPNAAVRFVAQYKASGKLEELRSFLISGTGIILVANFVLGAAVCFIGPWIAVHFYGTPALSPYLRAFAVIMMFGAMTNFFGKVLQGYRDVARLTVVTDFIGVPVMMVVAAVLLLWHRGLWGYLYAQVAGAVVVLGFLTVLIWKHTPTSARHLKTRLSLPDLEVRSFAATLFGIGILNFLMSQSDKILTGFYLDPRQLGIYAVAAAVVAYVPIALQSVNQIFSPTIADLHTRGERELLRRMYQSLTRWVLAFTLPLAIVIAVFAKPLMGIFGRDFEAGWPVLIIGALGQLANCGSGPAGYLLLMSGNERQLIKIQPVSAIVNITIGVILIPRWGIIGAAIAVAVTTVFTNTCYLIQVYKKLGLFPHGRHSLRLVLPALVSGAVVLCWHLSLHSLRPSWLGIVLGLMLGYATFLGVSLISGVDADDRLIGRAVWSKMKGILTLPGLGES